MGTTFTRGDLMGTSGLAEALKKFGIQKEDAADKEALLGALAQVLTHPGLRANPSLRPLAKRALFTASTYEWNSLRSAVNLLGSRAPDATTVPAVGRPRRKKKAAPRLLPKPTNAAAGDLKRLNDTQRLALERVGAAARVLSDQAAPELEARVLRLGYSRQELDRFLTYVKTSAPITINFKPEQKVEAEGEELTMIEGLRKSGRYKTQFETRVSGSPVASDGDEGGSRDFVERRLYREAYHQHPLVRSERPIYTALNGELACFGGAPGYGLSHLLLDPEVRARATLSARDSLHLEADQLGTFEHCHHVLLALHDDKLMQLLDVANGRKPYVDNPDASYLEVQIHGPVELGPDVPAIVLWNRYAGTDEERSARALAREYNAELHWTNGVDIAPGDNTLPKVSIKEIKAANRSAKSAKARVFDWSDRSRSVACGGEAPLAQVLGPRDDARPRGYTVLNRSGSGWYAQRDGPDVLVKLGPLRQRQAELFGSYLWRRAGLPAAEVRPCILEKHGAGVAVTKVEGVEEVSSSWNGQAKNDAQIQALRDAVPDVDALLLRGLLLDLITSNMDGAQSLLKSPDGVLFIDFGGTIHSTPRGRAKEARHFGANPEVGRFLKHLEGQIGRSHPIFSATPAQMQQAAKALLAEGLLQYIQEAATYAGMIDDPESEWTGDQVLQRLEQRARFLAEDPEAWIALA